MSYLGQKDDPVFNFKDVLLPNIDKLKFSANTR